MVTVDYVAQLAEVNAAISALTTGGVQSYTIAGRTVAKLNLATLYEERRRLERLATRQDQTGGGIRQRAGGVFRE
jgi:hypothetical protein